MKTIVFILVGAVLYHFHLREMDRIRGESDRLCAQEVDDQIRRIEMRYHDSILVIHRLHQAETDNLQQQLDEANILIAKQTEEHERQMANAENRWGQKLEEQAEASRRQLQQQYEQLTTEHGYEMQVAIQNAELQKAMDIQQALKQYQETQLKKRSSPLSFMLPSEPWQDWGFLAFCYTLVLFLLRKACLELWQQYTRSTNRKPRY